MIYRILSIETGKSNIMMIASYKSWYLISVFEDIMLLFIDNICNKEHMLSHIDPFVSLCLIQRMDSLCLKTRFWGTYFKHFTCQNISNINISMLLHGTLSCRFIAACVWRQVDIHRCQWLHPTRPNTWYLF